VFQKGLESWRVISGTTVFSGVWIFVVTFFACKIVRSGEIKKIRGKFGSPGIEDLKSFDCVSKGIRKLAGDSGDHCFFQGMDFCCPFFICNIA
jgi:hypothetical protein